MYNLSSWASRRSFWLLTLLTCLSALPTIAQIYRPEGINMPGQWNGYANYPNPATHFFFYGERRDNTPPYAVTTAGGIQEIFGPLAGSTDRYQTGFSVAASGGDVVGGSYNWLFTSGPTSGAYNNKWANTVVSMNTVQTYTYQGGTDNSVTLADGNYYTVNYKNTGYSNTQAAWLVTSAAPVSISSVSGPSGTVSVGSKTIDITLSGPKSAEENVIVRYSANGFSSSGFVLATLVSGNDYQATIPSQGDGATVNYYVLTSTVSTATLTGAPGNTDLLTLKYNNGGGIGSYSYTESSTGPVNVTFRVNMANETVAGSGLFVSGNFNSFSTNNPTYQLSQEGSTTIWSVTVPLAQNGVLSYKFYNGSYESIPTGGGCTDGGGNRTHTVGTGDETIDLVCYRQCAGTCPAQRQITFQVNMANVTVDPSGVFIAGSFNGFTNTAMTQVGTSSIYEKTLTLIEGDAVQYKFKNGTNGWENNPPTACNVGGNRGYTIGSTNATVGPVCFNECNNCTVLRTVTFRVDMGTLPIDPAGVHIAGSFQGWNPGSTAMAQVGSTSVYQYTTTIAEGNSIEYKFINGNTFGGAEIVSGSCANGGGNRFLTIPTSNYTTPTRCFGLCASCPPSYPVTFTVDLGTATPSPQGVHLAGNFQGWNPAGTLMTQIGTTSKYTITLNLLAGAIQYKFVNGDNWPLAENVPATCASGGNRFATISGARTMPEVCFGVCIGCNATNVWTGSSDNNFGNAANWTAGIAPAGCSTNIQVGTSSNQPTIASGTATLGSLTFTGSGKLTVSPGATLSVCGNINAGNIAGGGNLIINGAGAQNISLSAGKASFNDVSIAKSSGTVTVSSGVMNIAGTLSLSATSSLAVTGTGAVVLQSSSSGTARLAEMPVGASISGNLTIERKLPASTGWYFVSAPVTSSATLSQWSEFPGRVTPVNNATILKYTETDSSRVLGPTGLTVFSTGWRPAGASMSDPINPTGKPTGYRAFQSASLISAGAKLTTVGAPNVGDVVAPFTFTTAAPGGFDGGGWNLLGNPYPSEVDWNAVKFDAANTAAPSGNAINVYNGVTKTYASWTALTSTTGTAVNGGSRYIASGQAFFIKATGAGGLIFKEAHKNASNGNTFMRQSEENTLRLTASGNGYADEAALVMMDGADFGADRFDADKLAGEEVNLSIVPAAGLDHAISVMPVATEQTELGLAIRANRMGQYTLTVGGLETFAQGTRAYLRDAYMGSMTEVVDGSAYTFSVSADPSSQGKGRLSLVVVPPSVTGSVKNLATAQLSVWPNPTAQASTINVRVARLGTGNATITLTDAMGRRMAAQTAKLDNNGTTTSVSLQGLAKGVYTLRVAGAEGFVTKQIVVE